MVLLGDDAQVEARLVHLEIVLILTQDRYAVSVECTIGTENCFGCTRWISYVTLVMWNLVSVRLDTVLVLMQDRC